MRFDILTIFPNIFESYLQESIIKRAVEAQKIEIYVHDIRTFSTERHHKVDAPPFGGGPGMVMMAQPIVDAITHVKKLNNGPVFYMSPRGKTLTQNLAEKIYKSLTNEKASRSQSPQSTRVESSKLQYPTSNTLPPPPGLILLCGRYEGIDQRAIDLCVDEELSIGKYVLTGGELAAMVVIDVLSRFIPGVLGDNASIEEESFSKALKGKKEYPHYTQPRVFKGLEVPEVLLSGHHGKIKKWREEQLM